MAKMLQFQQKHFEAVNSLAAIPKKGVPSAVGFPHCAGSGEGF